MTRVGILACLFLLLASSAQAAAPLILISIDGFRPDYLKRGQTPVLAALAKTGVAAAMRPSFPSLTFPNHYTLVTGLRPDHHGVVDNVMFDPRIGPDKFTMTAKTAEDPRWWEGAKPLWVSAEEQGRITAAAGFVGTDKNIFGRRPHYLDPWRDKRPAEEVPPVALNWLDLPPNLRPSMEFLYFYEVDHEGHEHGPDSSELNAALRKVDAAVGALVKGLKKRRLYDKTNIVIVADHGMTNTPPGQYRGIDWLVPPGEGIVRTWGSGAGIDALPGHETVVAAILLQPHDHFRCWRKSEIPAALHYGGNARVPQFYCLNDPGWRFAVADDIAQKKKEMPGNHGYDPALPDMQALFVAHGPAFRRGATLPVFDNVDVYPMLARITGITPEPNDGDATRLSVALSPRGQKWLTTPFTTGRKGESEVASYIDQSLGDGEKIIIRARFHWLYNVYAWGSLLLPLAVLIAVLIEADGQVLDPSRPLSWAAFASAVWLILGLITFLKMLIRKWTTEIGITSHRFVEKYGVFSMRTNEIALHNIEGVRVNQTFLGRIFGYGTIKIEGTGVDSVTTPNLADPVGFVRAIQTAKEHVARL